jgi:hypothetical protein
MSLISAGGAVVGAGGPVGPYEIERSLRFNSADSAYLNRTLTTPTDNKKWTFSDWIKRSNLGANQFILQAGDTSNQEAQWYFTTSDTIRFYNYDGAYQYDYTTVQVFRDPSAWYHLVVSYDSTQATAANRFKVYINGSEITLTRSNDVALNATNSKVNSAVSHDIGGSNIEARWFNGYLTEINFIDGQALTPTSFGEFNSDTGVWQPKAYSGSYGTNGFYLKFADNSGTTSTTLGKDSSGNGNNWTPNNFSVTAGAGNDSLVDSPTRYGTDTGAGGEVRGNYATLNPIATGTGTKANGNLEVTGSGCFSTATISPSSGKWYWEVTAGSFSGGDVWLGIYGNPNAIDKYVLWGTAIAAGTAGGTASFSSSTIVAGDVIGIAWDMAASTLEFYRNGSSVGSWSGFTLTGSWQPGMHIFSGTATTPFIFNFGQRPFAYTAPSGFKALVTTNLPEPTIADGGEYFNTVLWTGNGSTQNITGVGFQPDFVWVKARSIGYWNRLYDAVRGFTKELYSNATDAENTETNTITAVSSDGFSLGDAAGVNGNTQTFVAWNWKANGAGSTNTAGTITSTVSANTTSRFSIVTYTGNGSAGATIGHGLGVAPTFIIVKNRSNGSMNWLVYSSVEGPNRYGYLNLTNAWATDVTGFNNVSPTSTVFSVGTAVETNGNGASLVAYCFAPVAGYSAFGSYTGNGSADGPFVYTGFRPRWIMWKNATTAPTNWMLMDTARNPFNVVDDQLNPNTSDAESTASVINCDYLSNGFKLRGTSSNFNYSGATIIYAAFAENPFSIALAR